MRHERQYAVEVRERFSHGKYGKEFYFGMYVPGFNKKDAEQVCMETLASMTFKEIYDRCVRKGMKPWQVHAESVHGSDKPIGLELAERCFSCKAYIE